MPHGVAESAGGRSASHAAVRPGAMARLVSTPRGRAGVVAFAAALAFAAFLPFDLAIVRSLRAIAPTGDVRRELELLQQWGAPTAMAMTIIIIALVDRARLRRTLDWLMAAGVALLVYLPLKLLIGRPRPKFDDPHTFLGPFGTYLIDDRIGRRHAWEVGSGISSDLWSMPSSHTLFAVLMTVYLCRCYPRLKPLAVPMACLVGVSRVWLGAHYPTDVLVGAAIGYVVADHALTGYWGVRLIDRVWRALVDRNATPAYPRVLALEARAGAAARGAAQKPI